MKVLTMPERNVAIGHLTPEVLQHKVMEDGKILGEVLSPRECADYVRSRLDRLPPEHRRFDNPHVYKVGISATLLELRQRLAQSHRGTNR